MNTLNLIRKQINKAAALHDAQITHAAYRRQRQMCIRDSADAVIFRIRKHEHLNEQWKLELVETIKDHVPECDYYWDAND